VLSIDVDEVFREVMAGVIAPLEGTIASLEDRLAASERRVIASESRITTLEGERPGRKPVPLVALRQRGVCAVDPDRDSATCAAASIYRYQQGCHGDACRALQAAAYRRRHSERTAVDSAAPLASRNDEKRKEARTRAQEIRVAWWAGEATALELAEMYAIGEAYVSDLLRRRAMNDLPAVEHEGKIIRGAPIRDYERVVSRPRTDLMGVAAGREPAERKQ
jgi:hypothetical protein